MMGLTRNRKLLLAVKVMLTLAFIALGVAYVISHREDFARLQWPSAFAMAMVSLAFMGNLYLASVFNTIVARHLGAHLSATESFAISAVAAAVNFLLPLRAGSGLRAMYLKRVHGFPYAYFASTLVVFYLATIAVASLAGMVSVTVIYFMRGYFRVDLFVVFPAVVVVIGAVVLLTRGRRDDGEHGESWWQRIWGGYRTLIAGNRLMVLALGLVAVNFLVSLAGWMAALREYVPQVGLADTALIVASQVVGGLVTITAGGTGFQELAGMYVGHRLGMTMVELFAVLVWTKILRILVAVVLALPSALLLRRRLAVAARSPPATPSTPVS